MDFDRDSSSDSSLDREEGTRLYESESAAADSLENWLTRLSRQNGFVLQKIADALGVQPSGIGALAALHTIRQDLGQLRKVFPVPTHVIEAMDALHKAFRDAGRDPVKDLAELSHLRMSSLRQFLTTPHGLSPGQEQAARAIRGATVLRLLAGKERLSAQLGSALRGIFSGKDLLSIELKSVSESGLRAFWINLNPLSPLAMLLRYALDIFGKALPDPFELPRDPVLRSSTADKTSQRKKSSPEKKQCCHEPGEANLLAARLAELGVAGVRVYSGVAVLYGGLAPFEVEYSVRELVASWHKTHSEEALVGILTLLTGVLPSNFRQIGLSGSDRYWIWLDLKKGTICIRFDPILDKDARAKDSSLWQQSRIVEIPLPAEIANTLAAHPNSESAEALDGLFCGSMKELVKRAKGLLREMAATSHRPSLSRLAKSWARYLLTLCRDEAYAAILGLDFTVGTTSNLHYVRLAGTRVIKICSNGYKRIGFSGELLVKELPDIAPMRLPTRADAETFLRAMAAQMEQATADLSPRLATEHLLQRHNKFASALYAVWKFILGVRPLEEETTTGCRIDLESGFVAVVDKCVAPYHERRIVVLPPTLLQWMKAYGAWLRVLSYRLADTSPAIACAIHSVTTLRLDGDLHPLFFKFENKKRTVALGASDLKLAFTPFAFKTNSGRSFVDLLLRDAGFDSASIMGWCGRGNNGQEICGDWSAVVPMEFLSSCAQVLENWLSSLQLANLPEYQPRSADHTLHDRLIAAYIPPLLAMAKDWSAFPRNVQSCPYADDTVAMAAIFRQLLLEWRSLAPPHGWTGVALSLIFEDGVCLIDELEAAMSELQFGTIFDNSPSWFVDCTHPELGIRRVQLSSVTVRLIFRAWETQIETKDDWHTGATDFTESLRGIDIGRLVSAAAAFHSLRMPAHLTAWVQGRIFVRTTRPESVARFRTGCCEIPTLSSLSAEQRLLGIGSCSDLLANAKIEKQSGKSHETVLKKLGESLEVLVTLFEPESNEWFDAAYCLHLSRTLVNIFTLVRYEEGARKFRNRLSELVSDVGLNGIEWQSLISECLPNAEREVSDSPTRTAINHCLSWLGVDISILKRRGPPPSAFVYTESITLLEIERALELLRSRINVAGDIYFKSWVALLILGEGAFRWDEIIHIRLIDIELNGMQPHVVITWESGARLKSENAPRVVPISSATDATRVLCALRSARFPGDRLVPIFGKENNSRLDDLKDDTGRNGEKHNDGALMNTLVTEALRCATGSNAISPHTLRGAFISKEVRTLLASDRKGEFDTLALRQRFIEISALAGHGYPGVTGENYVEGHDILRRTWVDQSIEHVNYSPSLIFLAAVTGIPVATYAKRRQRCGAQPFDLMEGFNPNVKMTGTAKIRVVADLVLGGVTEIKWDREFEPDGGLVRRVMYIGLRLLGDEQESARLVSRLPFESASILETGLSLLNAKWLNFDSKEEHSMREPFLRLLAGTRLPYALYSLAVSRAMLKRLVHGMESVGDPWHLASVEDVEELASWLHCANANDMFSEVVVREGKCSQVNSENIQRIRSIGVERVRLLPARHFRRGIACMVRFWSVNPSLEKTGQSRAARHVAFLLNACAVSLIISSKEG